MSFKTSDVSASQIRSPAENELTRLTKNSFQFASNWKNPVTTTIIHNIKPNGLTRKPKSFVAFVNI